MNTGNIKKSTLNILPQQKLSFIQKEFTDMFPYLKLEFFRSKGDKTINNGKNQPLNPDVTLAQLSKTNDIKPTVITGDLNVMDLERTFLDQFNIHVKVMRRSGKSWLETSLTNEWSLDLQNSQGKETSRFSEK